jgi:hypothetical protein
MVEPVSIHRKKDLRQARVFAEHLRLKLKAPASAVTDAVVARLADMLADHRGWQQDAAAAARAEMAVLRGEVGKLRALSEAAKTFSAAGKALDTAVAAARGKADA